MIRPSADESGFSLIETLVALAIVALLAATASAGIRQALESRERLLSSVEDFENTATLHRVLDRTLALALPPANDDTAVGSTFMGTPRTMTFAAPLPLSTYYGGPGRYSFSRNARGDLIVTYQVDANVGGGSGLKARGATLLSGTQALSFAYFGPISPTQSEWSPDWSRRKSIPQLVRIQWRQSSRNQEYIVRVLGARIDCATPTPVFERSCLE